MPASILDRYLSWMSLLVNSADQDGLSVTVSYGGAPVNQPPTADSVTPANGIGSGAIFSYAMSDPNGVEDISWAQIIVHESRSVANSCYLHYAPQGNRLFLRNDDGSAWLTSLVVGSPGVLQNSQCQVDLGNSAVSSAGPTRTLDLDIEFLQAGTKEHSLWLRDLSGETSGLAELGSWTATNTRLSLRAL